MEKLLIAECDCALRDGLVNLLRRTYDVICCADGQTAIDLMHRHRFAVAILDLALPQKDGLTVLAESAGSLPPLVLGVTDFCNDYVSQTVRELGASFLFRKPCLPRVVVNRMEDILKHVPVSGFEDAQTKAGRMLLKMNFIEKNDGFRFLKIALPLYAQDPNQRLCKELYVSVARLGGAGSWNQVERSIRGAIDAAYHADPLLWQQYFTCPDGPPTSKTFISRISQLLSES